MFEIVSLMKLFWYILNIAFGDIFIFHSFGLLVMFYEDVHYIHVGEFFISLLMTLNNSTNPKILEIVPLF